MNQFCQKKQKWKKSIIMMTPYTIILAAIIGA